MEKVMFKKFGTMIDCSRNGVMKVETVKKWIDLTADLDFNTLLLYMEDTFEVDNQPYFGAGRGRYSKEELKEIDRYAASKGMEVIPCTQTLAHMNALADCAAYESMMDCNDILLCGDDRVYQLIDDMFKSLSECLTSRNINIGLDEAYMVGRGKYYDLHGATDRFELLLSHIQRVSEIAKKYNYTLTMWSDMFFRLTSNWESYAEDVEVPERIKKLIPENVELVYWKYGSTKKEEYDETLKKHNEIKPNTWFAGGLWTWKGFAPDNKYAIRASDAAFYGCERQNTQNAFFTLWGDDGAECSKFAALPSLFYVSQRAKGNKDMEDIKKKFEEKFGIAFDDFTDADFHAKEVPNNTSKGLLFNDLFSGRMDTCIREEAAEEFKATAEKMSKLSKHEEYGYIFDTLTALAETASIKAELSNKLRDCYKKDDKEELKKLVAKCKVLVEKMREFYDCFEKQWFMENKGYGFDTHDIRIGGMIIRTEHCIKILQKFIDGEIDRIEELDEEPLDYKGRGKVSIKEEISLHSFKKIFTANRLSW